MTDSVGLPEMPTVAHNVVSPAPLLATTIARLHSGESLENLIARR